MKKFTAVFFLAVLFLAIQAQARDWAVSGGFSGPNGGASFVGNNRGGWGFSAAGVNGRYAGSVAVGGGYGYGRGYGYGGGRTVVRNNGQGVVVVTPRENPHPKTVYYAR